MIGADTNLLVRFLVKDLVKEAEKVKALLDSGQVIYINAVVLTELYWVLTKVYNFSKAEFIYTIDTLLETKGFRFFDNQVVSTALADYIHYKAEYPDCLIHRLNSREGLLTKTFDKNASELDKMERL